MGLDMYLTGRKFLSTYDENEKRVSEAVKDMLGVPFRVETIAVELAYWRKVNQIHAWFVANVQGGTDDCGEYDVSVENLRELLDTCETVLKDRNKAPELLPTAKGVFFGSEDYDDDYFAGIVETVEQIRKIIVSMKLIPSLEDLDISYRASW